MKKIFTTAGACALLGAGFLSGIFVGFYETFPFHQIQYIKNFITRDLDEGNYDRYGRLVHLPGKKEVECPVQTRRTGVIFAVGQSNIANHGSYRFSEQELSGVYNWFEGKCFLASSPLLGATGRDGEWVGLTGKLLIQNGVYDEVIVVENAVGGSAINRWAPGNDLNEVMVDSLIKLSDEYEVTEVLWHQGESDAAYGLKEVYKNTFLKIKENLRSMGVEAPIYLGVTSLCLNPRVTYPNRITDAQSELVDNQEVFLGANSDEIVPRSMRYDGCHFKKEGQITMAKEFSRRIESNHKSQ